MNENPALIEEVSDIRFQTLRNIYYHSARNDNLTRWNKIVNFLIVLSGTATAAGFLSLFPSMKDYEQAILGTTTTVLGAMLLIWDYGVRAKEHEILARRYTQLLGSVDGAEVVDNNTIKRWRRELVELSADEPPTLRALGAVSQNAALQALDGDESKILKVSPYQYFFRHMWSFNGTVFEEVDPRTDPTRTMH